LHRPGGAVAPVRSRPSNGKLRRRRSRRRNRLSPPRLFLRAGSRPQRIPPKRPTRLPPPGGLGRLLARRRRDLFTKRVAGPVVSLRESAGRRGAGPSAPRPSPTAPPVQLPDSPETRE